MDAEEFCRSVHGRLVRSLASYTGNPALAEELAQEARAWERWDRVQRMDAPAMWTYRTAMNLANSGFRRRRAEQRALRRLGTPPLAVTEPDRADVLVVRAAILELPPRQRAAIVLRYQGDLSVEETADVMRCAPGTVKALTSQAIANLRARIAPELVEPSAVERKDPV